MLNDTVDHKVRSHEFSILLIYIENIGRLHYMGCSWYAEHLVVDKNYAVINPS